MFGHNYGFFYGQHPQFYYPEPQPFPIQPNIADINYNASPVKVQANAIKPTDLIKTLQTTAVCQVKIEAVEEKDESDERIALTEGDLRSLVDVRKKYWTHQEDELLMKLTEQHGFNWKLISLAIPTRNQNQCYGRYRRMTRQFKRGWTKENDELLIEYVDKFGANWRLIAPHFQNYTSKQLRERYLNHLRPRIQSSDWTIEEDMQLCQLINVHGRKWKLFQSHLKGRSENSIKNRYYGHLQRIQKQKARLEKLNSKQRRSLKQA